MRHQFGRVGSHVEWQLAVLDGLGPDQRNALQIMVGFNGDVGGIAMSHAMEKEFTQETGLTIQQHLDTDESAFLALLRQRPLPETGRHHQRHRTRP
ncbi:hypothetical protein ACWDKQ_21815 [Saccharopolyspora sp. NPDC000995]